MQKKYKEILFILFLVLTTTQIFPQDVSVSAGADVVSRYIWRGLNVNDAANIQPAITLNAYGFALGLWGSYSLDGNNAADDNYALSQEIDTWLSYTVNADNEASFTAIVTDYYYPRAGVRWGNFNNYDDPDGAGAHVIEAGLIVKGPASFPVTISGYYNFHNDAGNNTYFQIDYPFAVNNVAMNLFCGAAGGSKDNPAFYGTEKFNVINLGVKASKEIKITDEYSLPVSTSLIVNPRVEIVYLVFGLSF